VIAHRSGSDGPEILLVTSRSAGRWIIPKGNIEPELTARESAAMEAYEEGGVKGHVHPTPVGMYEHGDEKRRWWCF
jgi:8-oxo-dGTP pyrophosphatase MutT (NUDIX family)